MLLRSHIEWRISLKRITSEGCRLAKLLIISYSIFTNFSNSSIYFMMILLDLRSIMTYPLMVYMIWWNEFHSLLLEIHSLLLILDSFLLKQLSFML